MLDDNSPAAHLPLSPAGEPYNLRIAGSAVCREDYCTKEIETDMEPSFY
jgi:hypothetical protein